jgi:hypothetical protein
MTKAFRRMHKAKRKGNEEVCEKKDEEWGKGCQLSLPLPMWGGHFRVPIADRSLGKKE